MIEQMAYIKENLYEFLQNPTREAFVNIIFNGVGEQDDIEFKRTWIENTKLSEIILGMANTGGGVIILGVEEREDGTTEAVGLEKLVDKEKLYTGIKKYLPDKVKFDIYDFDFSDETYSKIENKLYQLITVHSEERDMPYILNRDTYKNAIGCVFIRKGTKTFKANSQELDELVNKKIRSMYTEGSKLALEEHLEQLKTLYQFVGEKEHVINTNILNIGKNLSKLFQVAMKDMGEVERIKNPFYPDEEYEEFISNMIKMKKVKIEKVLDLK